MLQAWSAGEKVLNITSTVGEDLTIVGNVRTTGSLRLEGRIEGRVECETLVLGETGVVEGDVISNEVVVFGKVLGGISADQITLQGTCVVVGDLSYGSLAVERGAQFDGRSSRKASPGEQSGSPVSEA